MPCWPAGLPRRLDADQRLQALRTFMNRPEAAVLTAINKRIVNILRKAPPPTNRIVQAEVLIHEAEITLHRVLSDLRIRIDAAVAERRYADALTQLTGLSPAVDDFFERLLVMDENPAVRDNRLALLRHAQELLGGVADLSRLPG